MGHYKSNKHRPRKRTKRSKMHQISALERERKRREEKQKQLAAKREAGLLNNAVQETSSVGQIIISVPQTSNTQTYNEHSSGIKLETPQYIDSSQVLLPSSTVESSSAVSQTYSEHLNDLVYKIPQDINITKVTTCDLQDISTSQSSLSSFNYKDDYTLPFTKYAVESSSTVQQMTSKIPQDTNITKVTTCDLQDISTSQSSLPSFNYKDDYTLPFTKCAVESSSAVQQMTSNIQTDSKHTTYPVHITPRDTNITEIVSGIPLDTNSSQASVSSAAVVKDNYKSPYFKHFSESSFAVQKTANFRTYSRRNNNPVPKNSQGTNIKIISGVPQDNNSSRLEKRAAQSSNVTQTVLNSAFFTLPLVTSPDKCNLPIISNSEHDSVKISSADCSSLPVVSSTAQLSHKSGLMSKDHILHDRHSVATQVNFDLFKKYKITKLKPLPKEAPIRGRRIVDFQHIFRALKEVNNHSVVGCNLNNMIITSEKKNGICSTYNLKCVVCNFEKEIWSEFPYRKRNANTEFVSSILSIKCSFQQANLLLAKMELPSIGHADFLKEYAKVCFPSSKVDSIKINQTISGEAVQSEPQVTAVQHCSFTEKNVGEEPQLATMKQCSSDGSDLLERVNVGGIVVEDQIEIKEENTIENEFEILIPDQRAETSYVNLIDDQEQTFITTIKQEINSDDEDLTSSTANETLNKESENNRQSILRTLLPQQNEKRTCENKIIIDQQQANLQTELTVENIQDSNILVKFEHDATEITDKDNIIHFDKEVETEVPLKKARIETYKKLNNFEYDTESVQTAPSEEKNTFQKRFELNGPKTATSSTLTGGNLTAAVANRGNTVAESQTSCGNTIMSSITNARDVTATSSITNAENIAVLIPMQHIAKSGGNEALMVSQMPHTSGTYKGAHKPGFIPGTSSIIQQHTGQTSNSVLPLVSMHQSWASSFNTSVNPLILLPGVGGAAYMTGVPSAIQQPANAVPNVNAGTYLSLASTVVQQPVNSSNNIPGVISVTVQQPASLSNVSSTSGVTCVPLRPAVVQQHVSSSNSPPVNTDGSRWIGRGNMNVNNPFCTLPGGAPKGSGSGLSDPTAPKSESDQSNHHQSKRPRFRCDDCDISFAKYESWDSHRKIYCIKRLKLPPSSTITNHQLVNNSFPSNCAYESIKPQIEELLSAMAIKRSFLESSMKTALDAQYVINLHKSAQDLTRKSFKKLDNALNKEKALLPGTSLEEQKIVSEARAQALIRAETAYKQEKHSAAAVEQVLYRQKVAIEATLAATGHEQTALISTLKGLKVQANQNDMSSIYQNPWNETNFNQEKLLRTEQAETTEEQQVVLDISSKSTPVHAASHSNVVNGIFSKSTPVHTDSHANVVHNISSKSAPVHTTSHVSVSHFNGLSKKLNTVNFERNKTWCSPMDLQSKYSPLYQEVNAITSYLSTKSPSFQSYNKFPSQKDLDLSVAISAETSSAPEYEEGSMSFDYSHFEELRDLNTRVISENTHVTVYQTDKSFSQRVKSNEMMDINIAPLNENIQVLNCDSHQNSVPHNFLCEETKLSDSSQTLTKENFQKDISLPMSEERPFTHHS